MNTSYNENDLIEYFKPFDSFTSADISLFFRKIEPEIKQSTINWRTHRLVQKSVIYSLGKGIFTLKPIVEFKPIADKTIISLSRIISKTFPFINFVIWNNSILNTISQHISNKNIILIEVEKDSIESVFLLLKEKKKEVYINPSAEIINNYIYDSNKTVYVIKNLISESPLLKVDNYTMPSIEKILVDVYSNPSLFQSYQGRELRYLFTNAFEKYSISVQKMIRYATRRGKKEELLLFIQQIIGNKN